MFKLGDKVRFINDCHDEAGGSDMVISRGTIGTVVEVCGKDQGYGMNYYELTIDGKMWYTSEDDLEQIG
jgi:hypothetical protein